MATHFGFVSTYAPTHCGIATFSASLVNALRGVGNNTTSVVRLVEAGAPEQSRISPPEVVANLRAGDAASLRHAVNLLNEMDVVIIQHEFGIHGGTDGDEVLALLRALRVPTIVVAHTVLPHPSPSQEAIFNEICTRSAAVVTMSQSARKQVISQFPVDPSKVHAIPHGARSMPGIKYQTDIPAPLILTWGLIGPGKGIEWAIEAMAQVKDLQCKPRYLVAGRTHPRVFERSGEAYRQGLQKRIQELGLNDTVRLSGDYMTSETVDRLVANASIVLLPYDSTEQATSGVLIEALAACRPVIATGFPHAKELLANGAGLIVDHRSPDAIAKAIRTILGSADVAARMSSVARAQASDFLWPAVARRYSQLASALILAQVAA